MKEAAVHAVMYEARNCASVMLDAATYVREELPSLPMDEALRAQTEQVCNTLVGTQHDITSELFEIDGLLGSGAAASTIRARLDRLVRWFREDITGMHQLVEALDAACQQDTDYVPAYVLVADSAANILNAFNRTRAAADALGDGAEHEPGGGV